MQKLTLALLPQRYAVCRLDPNGHIPPWALMGDDFVSLTRTNTELSVICLILASWQSQPMIQTTCWCKKKM